MKIGIFADPHYSSAEITCGNRYNSQSLRKIRQAYARFAEEKCDLIVCLGDLTDTEETHETEFRNLKQIAEVIGSVDIPTVCVMGNHDAFAFTADEFYAILGDCRPRNIVQDGKQLIFLDTCYFKDGRHYAPGDSDWTDTFLPDPAALKARLSDTALDTYIFLHQNIDPDVREDHRLYNAAEVAVIIENHNVKAVYQGHYHPGKHSVHNGVKYVTFPAMCEAEDRFYILNI